jgi:hypothetical protein
MTKEPTIEETSKRFLDLVERVHPTGISATMFGVETPAYIISRMNNNISCMERDLDNIKNLFKKLITMDECKYYTLKATKKNYKLISGFIPKGGNSMACKKGKKKK